MGFVLRQVRGPFTFQANGRLYHFHPPCAAAYGTLVGGHSNEPETIKFLGQVFSRLSGRDDCTFIDVGASIGEIAIFAAGCPGVKRVFAFEPQLNACEAIRQSASVNKFKNIQVFPWAVSDVNGEVAFAVDEKSPTAAAIRTNTAVQLQMVPCRTLDECVADVDGLAVLVVDVEGSELKVMKGGREFIRRCRPLIIFEYHHGTRKHFSLDDMAAELGPEFAFFRLRCNGDGRLDRNLGETWNVVAVPVNSVFEQICLTQIFEEPQG